MTDLTTPQQPPREVRSLRLRPGGIAAVQELADREGLSWDEMARLLLSWATYKFEPGWTKSEPGQPSPDGVVAAP
jgi:hypothetical protein